MKNRILYIGETGSLAINGMDAVNSRNVSCLRYLYGDSLFIYEPQRKNSKIERIVNILLGNLFFIAFSDYKEICKIVADNRITSIFIAHSGLGNVALYLRRKMPSLNIITFFHNIEKQSVKSKREAVASLSFYDRLYMYWKCKNERRAVDSSDILITLNRRDSILLESLYSRKATFELPTSFVDRYDEQRAMSLRSKERGDNRLKLLFVGVNFYANTQGVEWFIDNVLGRVDGVHLTVVGKGMDRAFKASESITVNGFVDDLSDYYYSADIVVVPIFAGGGMKTKTAEALMYGSAIVASREGFEGYDLDYSKVGGVFNSAEEAIDLITFYRDNRDQLRSAMRYSRDVFKERYTLESSIKILKQYL